MQSQDVPFHFGRYVTILDARGYCLDRFKDTEQEVFDELY